MSRFARGEKIVCTDASFSGGLLEEGRVYVFQGYLSTGDLYLKDIKGGWGSDRFVRDYEEEKPMAVAKKPMAVAKKKSSKRKGCGCIALVNKHLAKVGVRLNVIISLSRGGLPTPSVETMWIEGKKPRGKRLPLMVPTYCPFCGKEYIR